MRLNDLLKQKKAAIIKEWFNIIINSYPSDTAHFLKKQKDHFANPVGTTILHSLKPLFDEILNGMDHKAIVSYIDPMIRIRAVQVMFSPSQAVGFIFSLKEAVRSNLKKREIQDDQIINELIIFESKIDEVGLMAFDIFMKCREQIYELKSNGERNRVFRAFQRAGLISEIPDGKPPGVMNVLKSSNTAVEPLDDRVD